MAVDLNCQAGDVGEIFRSGGSTVQVGESVQLLDMD